MFRWVKTLFEKKPPAPAPEFRHPELGLLTFDSDSDMWNGSAHRDGREIPFVIGGRECPPNPNLTSALLQLLDRFAQAESSALELLCPPDVPATKTDFTFQCVSFLRTNAPDEFTFAFILEDDAFAIWRVEFVSGLPKYTGRDD